MRHHLITFLLIVVFYIITFTEANDYESSSGNLHRLKRSPSKKKPDTVIINEYYGENPNQEGWNKVPNRPRKTTTRPPVDEYSYEKEINFHKKVKSPKVKVLKPEIGKVEIPVLKFKFVQPPRIEKEFGFHFSKSKTETKSYEADEDDYYDDNYYQRSAGGYNSRSREYSSNSSEYSPTYQSYEKSEEWEY